MVKATVSFIIRLTLTLVNPTNWYSKNCSNTVTRAFNLVLNWVFYSVIL